MPEDYRDNWMLYDQVCGTGWLIKDENAADPDNVDFAWDSDLRRMNKNGHDMDKITILDRVMVVRVRLPWNEVNTEWLISDAEMEEFEEDLEILEVYIRARRKNKPSSKAMLMISPKDRRAYEAAPNEYEITEKKYLVTFKMSPETRMWLRGG
jgi:hypothetical protein